MKLRQIIGSGTRGRVPGSSERAGPAKQRMRAPLHRAIPPQRARCKKGALRDRDDRDIKLRSIRAVVDGRLVAGAAGAGVLRTVRRERDDHIGFE